MSSSAQYSSSEAKNEGFPYQVGLFGDLADLTEGIEIDQALLLWFLFQFSSK